MPPLRSTRANDPVIALFAPDEKATDAIGAKLADVLQPGEVVALKGDLGTGKTALARAVIRARLGDPGHEVPSPTFAIVQPYRGIVHADLYRLADESEMMELGLLDGEEAIILVEWPERAPMLFDREGLNITIHMGEGGKGRRIGIEPMGGREMGAIARALAPWREKGPQ